MQLFWWTSVHLYLIFCVICFIRKVCKKSFFHGFCALYCLFFWLKEDLIGLRVIIEINLCRQAIKLWLYFSSKYVNGFRLWNSFPSLVTSSLVSHILPPNLGKHGAINMKFWVHVKLGKTNKKKLLIKGSGFRTPSKLIFQELCWIYG